MAAPTGGVTKERKGKKPHKNKPTSKKYTFYINNKGRFCPRCGAGIILANHENRLHCGKCNYTEFKR